MPELAEIPPITPEARRDLVQRYRGAPLFGQTIDLEPYRPEHAPALIALRNAPRVKYFLNQTNDLTLEDQKRWYETVYQARDNDIQWVVRTKSGDIIGANALYFIDVEHGVSAEKGRQVIREDIAGRGPFALEADYLACKIGLYELGLERISACFRPENVKVESMNRRMGFVHKETKPFRGLDFLFYECTRATFQDKFLTDIISHWKHRDEATTRST